MGATAIYTLPWPELTDPANGPIAFQALAQATEDAIRGPACTLVTTATKTTSNNEGVGPAQILEVDMGPFNLPGPAQTVVINISICVDTPIQHGLFDQWAKWDGVELYRVSTQSHSDSDTHDRLYSFGAAVKNQAAGNHSASIGFAPSAGQVWCKHLSYSIIALG